jgi:hypothetical protein
MKTTLQAIDMYNMAGMWEEAHHLASKYMDPIEVSHPRKKGIL